MIYGRAGHQKFKKFKLNNIWKIHDCKQTLFISEQILQWCGQCGNYWVEFECKTTDFGNSITCPDGISFFCQNGTTGINYGNGLSVMGPDVTDHDESNGYNNVALCVPEIVSSY